MEKVFDKKFSAYKIVENDVDLTPAMFTSVVFCNDDYIIVGTTHGNSILSTSDVLDCNGNAVEVQKLVEYATKYDYIKYSGKKLFGGHKFYVSNMFQGGQTIVMPDLNKSNLFAKN